MASFIEITFNGIKNEIENYLRQEYNKSSVLYSPASPYGQILSVIENLHQLSFLYLKNTINQFDLSEPNSNNPRIIRNAAISAGHSPGRAISATGTLKFTLKSNADIERDIPGSRITFANRLSIKNKTNSLKYSFNLGSEKVTHKLTTGYQFFVPIIQGEWVNKTFTGDGTELQTINVQTGNITDVENFNFEVQVNGEFWSTKKHIYEMLPEEKACVVRTGFNGGVDIIFGNGGFGMIPQIASEISINFLQTDGQLGNIFRRTSNDWVFIDDVIDGNGQSVDMEKSFTIDIFNDINFGSDQESIKFTKSLLPFVSNNFVLGLPQQYAYEIKKLGVFSHVNAYEQQGTIFIVATPNIKLFKNQNADYFNINISSFTLDRYEISKIDKYLRTNGNIQLTRRYKIQSPILSYYVMNVFVIPYSDATDDSVNAQILDKISEYFLNLSRIDRVPKLDIIRELSSITDIHSVDIQFISKKNEDYHRQALIEQANKVAQAASTFSPDISAPKPSATYNPNENLGLDPVLGDILFEPSEVPVIRGGWVNRSGVPYSDSMATLGLKSVNIIKRGVVDSKNRPNT
jgi:hypothetical protein